MLSNMPKNIIERFLGRLTLTNNCWVYKAPPGKRIPCLRINESKYIQIHRLSYLYHVGNIPKNKQVKQICGNRVCANPDHLKLFPIGHHQKGENNSYAKINEQQVIEIRKDYSEGIKIKILAEKYKLKNTHISSIVNYHCWKNI